MTDSFAAPHAPLAGSLFASPLKNARQRYVPAAVGVNAADVADAFALPAPLKVSGRFDDVKIAVAHVASSGPYRRNSTVPDARAGRHGFTRLREVRRVRQRARAEHDRGGRLRRERGRRAGDRRLRGADAAGRLAVDRAAGRDVGGLRERLLIGLAAGVGVAVGVDGRRLQDVDGEVDDALSLRDSGPLDGPRTTGLIGREAVLALRGVDPA